MKHRETWELKNMVKALSMLELLNTEEENKRLQEAKQELHRRGKLWQKDIANGTNKILLENK